MKIIDTHAHIYPDVIADKAVEGIGKFYGLKLNTAGRIANLEASMKSNGIYKTVVCSVATSKKQVSKINDFMASQLSNPLFHPLATLHPDMDPFEVADETARIKELGLKGIKLHPDCQAFKLCGERSRRLLDAIGDFDLPILVHTGDKRFDFSHPRYMIEIATDYPRLHFIAAHFGGWTEWDEIMKYKGLKNVCFDPSPSLYQMNRKIAKAIILDLGVEKFMFGTDFPIWESGAEIRMLLDLELGDKNNEMVFHKNAERLFGIVSEE